METPTKQSSDPKQGPLQPELLSTPNVMEAPTKQSSDSQHSNNAQQTTSPDARQRLPPEQSSYSNWSFIPTRSYWALRWTKVNHKFDVRWEYDATWLKDSEVSLIILFLEIWPKMCSHSLVKGKTSHSRVARRGITHPQGARVHSRMYPGATCTHWSGDEGLFNRGKFSWAASRSKGRVSECGSYDEVQLKLALQRGGSVPWSSLICGQF